MEKRYARVYSVSRLPGIYGIKLLRIIPGCLAAPGGGDLSFLLRLKIVSTLEYSGSIRKKLSRGKGKSVWTRIPRELNVKNPGAERF